MNKHGPSLLLTYNERKDPNYKGAVILPLFQALLKLKQLLDMHGGDQISEFDDRNYSQFVDANCNKDLKRFDVLHKLVDFPKELKEIMNGHTTRWKFL